MLTIIEISSLIISIQSFIKLSYSSLQRISVLKNNLSQYSVSYASFKLILNLFLKSVLLAAACDSAMFAPIDVPDLSN